MDDNIIETFDTLNIIGTTGSTGTIETIGTTGTTGTTGLFVSEFFFVPVIVGTIYVILALPPVNVVFYDWIPDYYYNLFAKALIILIITFLAAQLSIRLFPQTS